MTDLPSRIAAKALIQWAPGRPGEIIKAYAEGRLVDREAIGHEAAGELAEQAWVVIANASDWDEENRREWREAAERWRDAYFLTLPIGDTDAEDASP